MIMKNGLNLFNISFFFGFRLLYMYIEQNCKISVNRNKHFHFVLGNFWCNDYYCNYKCWRLLRQSSLHDPYRVFRISLSSYSRLAFLVFTHEILIVIISLCETAASMKKIKCVWKFVVQFDILFQEIIFHRFFQIELILLQIWYML